MWANLRTWLQQPNTWLSLFSLLVSGLTVVYVNYYPGTIAVYMPSGIAFIAAPGQPWVFNVGASLRNDAPANNIKIVGDAMLDVHMTDGSGAAQAILCRWTSTRELIPTMDFRRLYPQEYQQLSLKDQQLPDQFGPWHRRTSLSIRANELQTPWLVFDCDLAVSHADMPVSHAQSSVTSRRSRTLDVVLTVVAGGRRYRSETQSYVLPWEVEASTHDGKSWNWMERRQR